LWIFSGNWDFSSIDKIGIVRRGCGEATNSNIYLKFQEEDDEEWMSLMIQVQELKYRKS
jgi:hypothetical protein